MQTDDKYDEYLVLEAQQGNRNACEVLVGGYFGFVCNRVGAYYFAGADRDDVVQEGLIGLYNAIRSYKPGKASFRTFASVCIMRRVISAVRYYNRRKNDPLNSYVSLYSGAEEFRDAVLSGNSDMCLNPEDILINREDLVGMECTVSKSLSRFEYKIFLLFCEGLSYREISEAAGCSVKSVDNAIQRIRKKLSTVLPERRGKKCTRIRH